MSHAVFQQLAGTGCQQGPLTKLTPIVQMRPCLLAAEISLASPYSSASACFHWAHQIYFIVMGMFWFCPWHWSFLRPLLCIRRSCSLLLASRCAPPWLKLPNPVLRNGVQTQPCTGVQDSSLHSSGGPIPWPPLWPRCYLWLVTTVKETNIRQLTPQLYGNQFSGSVHKKICSLTARVTSLRANDRNIKWA